MSDIVIKAENLGKEYVIGHQAASGRYVALRDVMVHNAKLLWSKTKDLVKGNQIIQGDTTEEVWALKDVNFEIKRGEAVGIIGRNGAGKSTLLKILSRITEPTIGRVTIKGRVASLLEVGTGFHPELTGRENIYLNGTILGMTRAEIKKKFDEIVAFAEIEKYLDTPVKRYSSGMYVRLAFAVAAHLEPEILVVDEVLAVGDVQFQKKCLGKMGNVGREGRTVLFVSHNMGAINQLCANTYLLEAGRIVEQGDTKKVISAYLNRQSEKSAGYQRTFELDPMKDFQIVSVNMEDKNGTILDQFECDQDVYIRGQYLMRKKIPGLYGYITITRADGTCILEGDSFDGGLNSHDNLECGEHAFEILIPPRILGPGKYEVYLNYNSPMNIGGFNVDAPGTVCSFWLNDSSSRRGNKRNGYLSTLLSWRVTQ